MSMAFTGSLSDYQPFCHRGCKFHPRLTSPCAEANINGRGAKPVSEMRTLEVPIAGMDCAECTLHVKQALSALPGVSAVDVFLASEKACLRYDHALVDGEGGAKFADGHASILDCRSVWLIIS